MALEQMQTPLRDAPLLFDLLQAGVDGSVELVPGRGEVKPGQLPLNTVSTQKALLNAEINVPCQYVAFYFNPLIYTIIIFNMVN